MNNLFAESIYPSNPQGVIDRVRLEKVVVVPDGSLPAKLAPAPTDKTIDLEYGFQTADLFSSKWYGDPTNGPKLDITERTRIYNPFYKEYGVMHELGHARYLADLYAMNINSEYGSGSDQSLVLKKDGTRLIPKGTSVRYECEGAMMECKPFLPEQQYLYSELDAFALNAKAGQRAKCGNYNGPCDIGSFLLNFPQNNILKFTDVNNNPVANAKIYVYYAISNAAVSGVIYDKIIDNTPDITCATDANGMCSIGARPFGTFAKWESGVDIIKITQNNQEDFRYFFVPQTALAYFKTGPQSATYTFNNIDLREFDPENKALHKTATANRTDYFPDATHDPSKAVDGDKTTPKNSFELYQTHPGDWWQVDLGSVMNIGKVVIYPNVEVSWDWCSTFHIDASITGQFTGEQVKIVNQAIPYNKYSKILPYTFTTTPARYVRVTCDVEHTYSQLQEFEVYAIIGGPPIPTPSLTIIPTPTKITPTLVCIGSCCGEGCLLSLTPTVLPTLSPSPSPVPTIPPTKIPTIETPTSIPTSIPTLSPAPTSGISITAIPSEIPTVISPPGGGLGSGGILEIILEFLKKFFELLLRMFGGKHTFQTQTNIVPSPTETIPSRNPQSFQQYEYMDLRK